MPALTTEMKLLSLILTFLLFPIGVCGELKTATAELNHDLIPVYESLRAEGPSSDLVGKRLKLNLNLKYASDRHLLFTDTRIVIDSKTSYYMINWKFKPDDIKALIGRSNVRCTVTGRIVDVIKGPTSPRMPYIVVELESIEF